ncbi:hypothetical protein DB30_07120 [Enhygromyxa salina]|uniref:Phytase-like domain-containing protein n=1 Tax=Enhygromyxa salina TaxID=215803 RepID=A0A0C1Z948_9BACT|nr:hypothetical protein [Enhygromyxa salina]KIG14124.1 hypothetical protein DB30_07120 [Enhygromyxa salina]
MRRRWIGVVALLGCSPPSPTGVALDRTIREPSGVTTSPTYPGVLWTHGDSGAGNWLFAINPQGHVLRRLRVKGTINVDWEDITHDDRGNLWLGDIGNGDSGRRDLSVHRIPEPDPHADLREVHVDRSVDYYFPEQTQFGNKLSDYDSEALLWWRGQLLLLTKHRSDDRTRLYRFPSLEAEEVALERLASFDLGPHLGPALQKWSGQVTAAELASEGPYAGRYWAMLSYDGVFVFAVPDSGEAAELFDELVSWIAFDSAVTGQVEALTWDGEALLVINEARAVFRIEEPLTRTRYP